MGDDAADVKAAFKAADANGDGFITMEELKNVFLQLGDWTEEQFAELFDGADKNSDGKLAYEEFLDWIFQNEVDTATVAHSLSLLIVKKWDDDQFWAGSLGKQLFDSVGMDGTKSQVASFWAIIRSSKVELFKMTSDYNPDNREDMDGEFAKFLVEAFPCEGAHEGCSAQLLDIFKRIYDIVAACGAPVHGMVYVGHGNGDGALFESLICPEDSNKLLAHANAALGRPVDFLDFSGNCNEASLSNFANLGPYCRYMVASEFSVGGFAEADVVANGNMLTTEMIRRRHLATPEYCYHLFDLSGKSVLSALMKRVAGEQEHWKQAAEDIAAKNGHASLSIYCSKFLPEFLAEAGKAIAASDGAASLLKSWIKVGEDDGGGAGRWHWYDMKTLIGDGLADVFKKVRPVYRHTFEADRPALNGMYVRPAAVMKLSAAYDGLSDEERYAKYQHCDIEIYDPDNFKVLKPGFAVEGALPYGEEPFFAAAAEAAPDAGKTFKVADYVWEKELDCIGNAEKAGVKAGSLVKMNGGEFKVTYCGWCEGTKTSRLEFETETGAAEGDTMTIFNSFELMPCTAVEEVGDDIKTLLGW